MPDVLPIEPGNPNQEFTTPIGGVPYIFRIRWNQIDEAWFMDVSAADRTPIAMGIKVLVGEYLGAWSPHPLFASGVFVARALDRDMRDPGLADLGRRVDVVFYGRSDLVGTLLTPPAGAATK